mmetsp:Transcript_33014/g.97417  ORF Transcript_33014/g.97417 Transcript_33014/m.97417 type:complete len:274 (+) Transcript_33014:558-1379(+)
MATLPAPPPSPPDDDATCWICLDEGTDDRPLRRDCSCRGSAGYAHQQCLVGFATVKLDSTLKKLNEVAEGNATPDENGSHLIDSFLTCANCKQSHQRQLFVDMTLEYSTALKSRLPDNHQARYTARLCVASAYTQNFMLDSTFLGKAVTEYTNFIGDLQKEERNLIFPGISGGTPIGSILSGMVKRGMLATATDLLAEICERGGSYAAAVKLYQEALDLTAMDSECADLEVKLGRAKNRMVDNGRPGLGYIDYLRDQILVLSRERKVRTAQTP